MKKNRPRSAQGNRLILWDDLRGTKSPLVTLTRIASKRLVATRHTRTTWHFADVHPVVGRPARIPTDALMIAATALGLTAAFVFAVSAVLQQRAAHRGLDGDAVLLRRASGVRRLFGHLVRSPTWLAGWLTNLAGVGTQAAALKLGSVATVQPLMASQLLFVLALASGERRRWPSPRDWLSALAVCAGLVLLLTAYRPPTRAIEAHRHRVLAATACAIALVLVLRQVSRRSPPWLASLLIGVAAGLCHAFNAVYLKLTVENVFRHGVTGAASDWPVYALAVTAVTGMLLGQIAFASGPLPPAIAAMSVTNPVAGFALGVLAFDAPGPRDAAVLAAVAVAGVLLAAGIVGLANAPGTRTLYRSATDPPRSETRCASSRCPATAVSAPPGGSGGSTPGRTGASRP